MSNAHDERSGMPDDVAGAGARPSEPAGRRARTAREREVPVTAATETPREPSSAAPIGGEVAPARTSQQISMAERIETAFGRWGEQVGSGMASARRVARDRARALTAQRDVTGAEAGARPSGASEPNASPAERWPDSPTLQRAEGVVNRMTSRARPLASVIGQRVQHLFARAREEAEDIWAEAESMRARGARRAEHDSRMPKA